MVTISFTLARQQFELSADDVRTRLAQRRPDPIDQYWVEIDDIRWPVKQVMALATGLGKSDFQSQNSRRLLAKLGFTIGKGNAPLSPEAGTSSTARRASPLTAQSASSADVVLVGCVKSKRAHGAPAEDLYTSDYFAKMRAYAQHTGRPWFILSAEHGLVCPDAWLEPYDCYLPDMGRDYRRDWGLKVAKQLQQAFGPLEGIVLDIHAGSAYVESVERAVLPLGALVTDQLKGLSFGRRLSWYLQHGTGSSVSGQQITAHLADRSRAVKLGDLVASNGEGLRSPGVYSWWVDETGAADLSQGLGHHVAAGLIYAGLAGATRIGGSASSNTLWGRIATMHLGKRHEFSTLRRSVGSILASAHAQPAIDEVQLTHWMHTHLRVAAIPVADVETLDALETQLLAQLDPPLNLAKVKRTPLRQRLSELRKQYGGAAVVAPVGEVRPNG